MKKTLILSLALLLALAVPAFGVPVAPRHGGGGAGAFGPHGIRNRLDFMLNMNLDGRDRLSLLLDLGEEAFDSAAPYDEARIVTLVLSTEPPAHEHDTAAPRHETPESWTYETTTPTGFKLSVPGTRLRLIKKGRGFALDLSRTTLEGLKEMLHHSEGTITLYLTLSHNHLPHADSVGPRHAHALYEGAFEVKLTRRGAMLIGRGTPTEAEDHHDGLEAF
ncbi:MAG: hypothetical protein HS116_08685 [Planctomycetes bacterium]|nr:hypothetical protein [Planctomycetota bacterium]